MFTVAAYNIEGGVGVTNGYHDYVLRGWRHFFRNESVQFARIANFFDDKQIDIALISEIDDIAYKTKWTSHTKFISESCGLKHFKFFPTFRIRSLFQGGNAILSRYPLLSAETIKLPGGRWSRYINKATFKHNGVEIAIFITHLSLGKKSRTLQIKAIADILVQEKQPVVLGGDFNTTSDDELLPLYAIGMKSTEMQFTYPSWKPLEKRDYVLVNAAFEGSEGYVDTSIRFSDHLPIITECTLVNEHESGEHENNEVLLEASSQRGV